MTNRCHHRFRHRRRQAGRALGHAVQFIASSRPSSPAFTYEKGRFRCFGLDPRRVPSRGRAAALNSLRRHRWERTKPPVSQGAQWSAREGAEEQAGTVPALLHHVTVDLLRDSDHSLKKKAAAGVDGVTWREYGEGLEARISDLHGRIHLGAYPAQPSRRVVRYADDAVLGFQYREDAERFREQLRERLGKFGLELHPEKTRLIEFGRYATERRGKRGEGKPETFNFLGFTHICGTSHKTGYFTVQRKTIGKRMAAKLKDIHAQLRQRMHEKIRGTLEWLQSVVRGYFRYHAVPGNEERLKAFLHEVRRSWLRMLRRRSQRTRWTWERFMERRGVLLPVVEIHHPYPTGRFDAKHPRQEPCA